MTAYGPLSLSLTAIILSFFLCSYYSHHYSPFFLYKYPLNPLPSSPSPRRSLSLSLSQSPFLSPLLSKSGSKVTRDTIIMNHFAMKQNAFAACEEMRGSSIPVFCPKPRRVGQLAGPDPLRHTQWHASPQPNLYDKAGAELLDIFLTKGGEALSPPFFAGSPPTRSANPVVHDARFAEDKPDPGSVSPISPRNKTGCARTKFGFKPAPIRIEGFDCCRDRDRRRTHSITAVA